MICTPPAKVTFKFSSAILNALVPFWRSAKAPFLYHKIKKYIEKGLAKERRNNEVFVIRSFILPDAAHRKGLNVRALLDCFIIWLELRSILSPSAPA